MEAGGVRGMEKKITAEAGEATSRIGEQIIVQTRAASVSSGFAIPRLNGAGSLRRSDLIRNSFSTGAKILNF